MEQKYNFKLKGTGPISAHLGMSFYSDPNGKLCISPTKYIEKMVGENPKQNITPPLERGDHPELDTSELIDSKGITINQSLIRALQSRNCVFLHRDFISTFTLSSPSHFNLTFSSILHFYALHHISIHSYF